MMTVPRPFVVVAYLALISLKLTSSAVTVVDQEAFQSCIERRQSSRVGYEITKNDEKVCRLSVRAAQNRRVQLSASNRTSPISAGDESRDVDRLSFEYLKALGMWKNGDADITTALLDKVAPCRKRSKSVTKKWSSMYDARRHYEVILMKALVQRWQSGEGIVTFPPLDSSMNLEHLEAGELLLQRRTSAEMENFGKYSTMVYLIKDNRTLERVHADWRASCSSSISDAMVLDLDTGFIQNKWREEPSEPLQLRIRVKSRRQYLLRQLESNAGTPVIRQVVGLVLHFSAAEESISTHLLSAFGMDESGPVGSELSGDLLNAVEQHASRRQRRGARRTAMQYVNTRPPPTPGTKGWLDKGKHCRRASYRLDRNVYDRMNILHPEYEDFLFDIGECAGDCPYPLTSAVNATNHALAISVGARSNAGLSICCVPVSYKSLAYTYLDDNLLLQQKRLNNFRAVSCACR